MKVSELMTAPAITVKPGDTVGHVAKLMVDMHLSGVPVVSDTGNIVGMVTEEDMVGKHANVHAPTYFGFLGYALSFPSRETDDEVRHILATTAADLMNQHVISVRSDDDVDQVATLMVEKHVNPLPVVDGDRVVGMISHADILRLVVAEEDDGEANPL